MKQLLPNMEFGRRMAVERDFEKSDSFPSCNICEYYIQLKYENI